MVKILIVEDELIVAQSVSDFLSSNDFEVCGIADRFEEGVSLFEQHKPQLILCDVKIKGGQTGIDLVNHLKNLAYPFRLIYLTAYGDEQLLAEAWKTKPDAFLTKPYTEQQLLVSIKMAMQVEESSQPTDLKRKRELYEELSNREKEIIQLLAEGMSSKEIASRLFISMHTVDTHRRNILLKLDFKNTVQLIIFFLKTNAQ